MSPRSVWWSTGERSTPVANAKSAAYISSGAAATTASSIDCGSYRMLGGFFFGASTLRIGLSASTPTCSRYAMNERSAMSRLRLVPLVPVMPPIHALTAAGVSWWLGNLSSIRERTCDL